MQFVKGPIFANVILADEINRTPPKTQAALLEAMQEHQVTAAGVRYPLEEPFFVLATQNPIEMEGTYPLPEAQLDRFMFNVRDRLPPRGRRGRRGPADHIREAEPIEPLFTGEDVLRFHEVVRKVPVAEDLVRYAVRLASASRPHRPESPALTATLAYFLTHQRDSVGLLTFDEHVVELIGARYRPGHIHRLMLALEHETAGSATDLAAPLERIAQRVQKRGVIVLISDLLAPIDSLETNLGYLRTRGHEVIVYRVLDPAEVNFSFDAPAMFRDLESGREVYIDPEATRQDYLRRFGEHSAAIEKICANLGIDLHQFTTDRPLELSLFDYLHARQRRGRQVMRSGRMKPAAR
jgi:hypothetical protein